MNFKEEFIKIYTENITRNGSRELLNWLETTDFFTAPASTKYHCACEGGLVQHSVSVYHTLMDKHFNPQKKALLYVLFCTICVKLNSIKFQLET